MSPIELLAPAGNLKCLKAAVQSGAEIPPEVTVPEAGSEPADGGAGAETLLSAGIGGRLDALELGIAGIRELSESVSFQLCDNKRREELIDKLHAENQAYRSDLYKKLMMPLVNEIIFLVDNYTKLFRNYAGKDASEISAAKLLRQLGDIVEELENALYKNGIEAYESEDGSAVDLTKQKITKTIPTDDPKKDRTVCERLKKGFILEEKIIRQEQVSCYKYENNLTAKGV